MSALVARTGWYSARPVARATGLAPRWLVSARLVLAALGPFLSALVTRNGWYSARPVARATGLAPRWPVSADSARVGLSPLVQLGPRHSPRSAARVRPLVSTGSARAAPLASLRSSGHRCVHLLHDLRCVHLLHDSVPWWLVRRSRAALVWSPGLLALTAFRHSSSVPLSPPRARTPLEFGRSRQFHTCGHLVLTVPRVQVKRRPSASSRTHSDGPVSQTCLLPTLKGKS